MNNMWRITKYNPVFRDNKGTFLKDEWTSFSDVGKIFNGKIFTMEEYIKYENSYINSIIWLMECNKIDKLKIVGLEKYEDCDGIKSINNGMTLSTEQIREVALYILREKMWCKLEFNELFYVHFGYDFNMYIGSNETCEEILNQIKRINLFVEVLHSPYLDNQ